MDERDTQSEAYAERLDTLEGARWKQWLDVQAPYRWNLRRLNLGLVLDVGCGVGRNLVHLDGGVGVDHNAASVRRAVERGCTAYIPEDFLRSEHAVEGSFDTLLFAHVLEHMAFDEAIALVDEYRRWVRPGGQIVAIVPQEAGYKTDDTHVNFLDRDDVVEILAANDVDLERAFSFPFFRGVGRVFPYNETVVVGRVR